VLQSHPWFLMPLLGRGHGGSPASTLENVGCVVPFYHPPPPPTPDQHHRGAGVFWALVSAILFRKAMLSPTPLIPRSLWNTMCSVSTHLAEPRDREAVRLPMAVIGLTVISAKGKELWQQRKRVFSCASHQPWPHLPCTCLPTHQPHPIIPPC
jgi:hypothetical protein